jgi:hypothetical protein
VDYGFGHSGHPPCDDRQAVTASLDVGDPESFSHATIVWTPAEQAEHVRVQIKSR